RADQLPDDLRAGAPRLLGRRVDATEAALGHGADLGAVAAAGADRDPLLLRRDRQAQLGLAARAAAQDLARRPRRSTDHRPPARPGVGRLRLRLRGPALRSADRAAADVATHPP